MKSHKVGSGLKRERESRVGRSKQFQVRLSEKIVLGVEYFSRDLNRAKREPRRESGGGALSGRHGSPEGTSGSELANPKQQMPAMIGQL